MMRYATKNPHLERRFLVADAAVIRTATEPPQAIRQAYLATGKRTIRLRVAGASAWLTVRDPRQARGGFQYSIPIADAEDMMQRLAATPIVVKDRYRIDDGAAWTVDVFKGDNTPLAVAEVALDSPAKAIKLPAWLGDEVSNDLRYHNVYLALHPYSTWPVWQHDG